MIEAKNTFSFSFVHSNIFKHFAFYAIRYFAQLNRNARIYLRSVIPKHSIPCLFAWRY